MMLYVLCLQKGVKVPPVYDKPMIMADKTMVIATKPTTTFWLSSKADKFPLLLL